MESFIFSVSAVAPIVLMVLIGYFLKSIGMMKEQFAKDVIAGIIVAIISIVLLVVATIFDNTVAIFFGGTFWELKNADAV